VDQRDETRGEGCVGILDLILRLSQEPKFKIYSGSEW